MNVRKIRRFAAVGAMSGLTAVSGLLGLGTAQAHIANSSSCVSPRYQAPPVGAPKVTVSDDTAIPVENDLRLNFVIRLSKPATSDLWVHFCTLDGTARAGTHYTARGGVVGFRAGETAKVIGVDVLPASSLEGTRHMTMVIPQADGTFIEDGNGTGTIHYFT